MNLDLSVVFRQDDEMAVHRPELVWDGFQRAPDLLHRLATSEPTIPSLGKRLRHEIPTQRIWGFGASGAFERPDRHVRAQYLKLGRIPGAAATTGCVAFKGSEAVCENFDAMLERLQGMWNLCTASVGSYAKSVFLDGSMLSALERFPIIEGKPPGVHPLWDAVEEANCALELQAAHVHRYGELARAPVPLFVFRWPDEISARVLAKLEQVLTPKVARIVAAEVKEGLGTYVYYYPSLPLRVIHLQAPDASNGIAFKQRMQTLAAQTDPVAAAHGWVQLTARLLCLGYVATDPANLSRGYCLHAQNLVLDGGFVDVNSIRKMTTFPNQGALRFALTRTIQELAQGLCYFFIGSDARVERFIQWTPEVYAWVHASLRQALQAELDSGRELNSILVEFCNAAGSVDHLSDYFKELLDLAAYRPEEPEPSRYRLAD